MLKEKGFLEMDIDPGLDLFAEISKLKKEKNAVILAHYYQDNDIQDIADYIGDSLGLSQEAAKTDADIIVFAGVHFMAETAKILSPEKKVLLPDLHAGCSLADSCPTDKFRDFKNSHPEHIVISYINCSAEIKAMTDIVVTSSNAEKIVNGLEKDEKIIFAPDRNLGKYISKITGRSMLLWDGACMVHELFSHEKIIRLKEKNPNAKIIAHPECITAILDIADFIGSTTALLNYTSKSNDREFIVVTETGIIHQMQKNCPDKTFIPAPPENNCACNNCPHMKLNTLEKLYICMKYEQPEIIMPIALMNNARNSINRMLALS
jgi:quinolinate synthase